MIENVSQESVKELVGAMLSSKPTLVVSGDPSAVPGYEKVAKFFER